MKDINLYVTHNSNNDFEEESEFFLTKLWNSLKRKSIKSRNIKKPQSSYDIKDGIFQNSDNESDKTDKEHKLRYAESRGRKTNSVISNNSDKKKYNKRDNSLDIVRNKYDEYEIVLPYQRYIK